MKKTQVLFELFIGDDTFLTSSSAHFSKHSRLLEVLLLLVSDKGLNWGLKANMAGKKHLSELNWVEKSDLKRALLSAQLY